LVYLSYYYIGRIRLEQGGVERDKLAEDAFKKVLELKPTHAESAIALASIYEERKNRPQAMQLLENFQMKRGPNPQIALILAQHYIESKKEELALEQYKIVEANSEDDLNAKVKVALLYVELKRFPEAIAKLEEILILVPESDKIRFYLGAVYEEINEIPSAIAQFRKIPTSSPFYVESVIHEAYLQKLSNNVDEAIATVKEGIENRDDVPQMYTLYASLLDDKKEYQKAVSMLTGAIEKIPTDTQLHFYLGSMYDKLGDKKLTIASMRKVLELDAEHVRALNYLAYTYAETDQNLDEAEQMARKALRKNPTDVYIMDTLGWVLYKQGNGQESVKLLEVAHNTKPDESIIAEHLGDAYFKLQLHEKARRMYNVVLEIEKDETTLAKVRQKLAGMDGVSKFQHRKPASLDQNQDNSK
jgi:tetratricopeptide (TPR) repeat protein